MSYILRNLCLILSFAVAVFQPVFAHEHHDELTEEAANAPTDAILWIHIFLQTAVWGILFPVGMVLGITRSRWHVPLQVGYSFRRLRHIPDFFLVECWFPVDDRRVHIRSFTQRATVLAFCSRQVCVDTIRSYHWSTIVGNIPQAPYPRKDIETMGSSSSWHTGKNVAHSWLGTNALWCPDISQLLPWRQSRCVCFLDLVQSKVSSDHKDNVLPIT